MEKTKEKKPRPKKERKPLCSSCLWGDGFNCEETEARYYRCKRYVYNDPDSQSFFQWFSNRPSARIERARREAEQAAAGETTKPQGCATNR